MTKGITHLLGSVLFLVLLCCSTSKLTAQCATGETEYTITVNDDGDYITERSWSLVSADGTTIVLEQTCGNYLAGAYSACLTDGMDYTFNAYDDYGDSWNGGTFSIALAATGCDITSGSPTNGATGDNTTTCDASDLELAYTFTSGGNILGCIDPNSANYNACATEDDGSCVYPADGLMCVVTGTISTDNATFADSGDTVGEYAVDEDCILTICPATTGAFSTIDFTAVSLENCCDVLSVYNGTTIDCVLEADLQTPMMFRSTDASGCLTVKFTSDGSVTSDGWFATIGTIDTPETDPCSLPDPDGTDCATPMMIASLPYTATGMTTEGFGDDYSNLDACNSDYLGGDDFVYEYTPTTDEAVSITLNNTATYVGIFIFDGCPDDANTTCVDLATTSGTNPAIESVALTGGVTYKIMISTWPAPQSTAFDIDIQVLTCSNPTVDATAVCNDGDEANFYIDVTTTFGSGTAYTISNTYDTNTAAAVDGQTMQLGPFPNGTSVDVTVSDDLDASCAMTTNGLTNDCTPLPAGSTCEYPMIIASLPYTEAGMTTEGFGDDYSSADACNSNYLGGDDFVYSYTPSENEIISIDLINTGTWVGVFVFDGCPNDANTTCVGINTNLAGNPFLEEVVLMAGTTYFIMVSTYPAPQSTAFDIDMQILTCSSATVDATTVCNDGDEANFYIDVTTTFGSGTAYTISNTYDTNTAVAVDGQAIQIGPFPNGTSLDVVVIDDSDASCATATNGLTSDCTPLPPGSTCEDPAIIANLPYTATGMTTEGFGDDYSSADACNSSYLGGDDFVYSYTPTESESISIDLTNTDTWVGVFVFDGCPNDANTTCVGTSNNGSTGNPFLEEAVLMAGTTYFIMVSTYPAPQSTAFDIDIQILSCNPTIEAIAVCDEVDETMFYIDVTPTFGNLTAYTISNSYDTNTAAAVDGQATQIGPFPNGTSVDITVANDDDASCTATNSGLTNDCSVAPLGTDCDSPAVITSLPYIATGLTTEGFGDDYDGANACDPNYLTGDDFVYEYTPTTDELVGITLSNTNTFAGVFIFDGCPNDPNANCVAANVNELGNPTINNADLIAGTTYKVVISTWAVPQSTTFDIEFLALTCISPTLVATAVCNDGDEANFYIDVTTTFGSGTAYTISNNYDANAVAAVDGQTVQIGPFPNSAIVDVSLSDDGDANCVETATALTENCIPIPDSPCEAQMLMVDAACTTGDNTFATIDDGEPAGSCWIETGISNTLWYSFIAPASGNVTVSTDYATSNNDTQLALYESTDGDCNNLGSLVQVACNDDGNGIEQYNSIMNAGGLVAGEMYYVQLDGYNGTIGEFCIEVIDNGALAQGSICSDPFIIDGIPYNETGATTEGFGDDYDSNSVCSSFYMNGDDIVYAYTPTADECVNVTLSNTDTWTGVFILDGCPNDVNAACVANDTNNGGNPFIAGANLLAGTTYYIIISTFPTPQFTAFDITIDVCSDAPENDLLCDAISLEVDAPCTTGTNISSTLEDNEPAGSCWEEFPDPTVENTVWYSFVAPASGTVNISTDFETQNTDTQLTLFELNGDCTDLTNLTEIACDDDSGEIVGLNSIISVIGLTAGNTYYVQVDGYDGTIGEFCIEVTANVAPEGNDACIGATPIACGDTVEDSTLEATTVGDPTDFCGTTPDAAGVWYTIEGTGDLVTVSLCEGTDYDSKVNVYSGNCNMLECVAGNDDGIGCENGTSLVNFTAQDATTYYIFVNGWNGAIGNFTLNISCETVLTGNDNLCDAIALTMDADCVLGDNTNTGLEENEPSGACWSDTNLAEQTVWFSFEAPETGAISVSTDYPAGLTDTQIALYEMTTDCSDLSGLTQIACDDDSGVVVNFNSLMGASDLTPGQTYYVQVDGWNGATGSFCISVETIIPPANDKCSAAENLVQNADCQATTGSISGAGPTPYPGVDCNNTGDQSIANDDVWYSFTATTENVIVEVDANFDSVVEMFEGDDCDALTSILCADATFGGLETIVANDLTIGETYYVRTYSFDDGIVADPTFSICVYDAPEPPANDNCDTAISLTQSSTCEPTTATIYGATDSGIVGCSGSADDDVWFSFEATAENAVIEVDAIFNATVELFDVGDCADPASYLSLACQNGSFAAGLETMLAEGLTIGNTYIVRVFSVSAVIQTETDFTICVTEIVAPTNDFCGNAIAIACGETVSGTTFLTTNDPEVDGTICGTTINTAGVWYTFVGDGTFITASTCNAASFDTKISIFTGSCTALTCLDGNDDSGGCSGNTSEVGFDSVDGTTYFILVHGYNGAVGDFDLSISCLDIPDNDNLCDAIPLVFNADCTTGYNTAATVQENEPAGSCWLGTVAASTSVWYSFVAPPSGNVTLTTDFETDLIDTQLGVYELTGDCGDLSTLVEIGCDEDGGTLVNYNSYVELTDLVGGTTYYVQVDGYNDNAGNFCIAALADACSDSVVSPADYVQEECVSAIPDVAAAEATIGYELDGVQLTIQWYYDAAYTEAFMAGAIIRSTINSCETQEIMLYAQATCFDGSTFDAGTLTLMLFPAPQVPAIIRTDSDCSYLLVSGCPDDVLNPASIADVAPGTDAQLVSIEVTTAEGCTGTFSVVQAACPACILDYEINFELDIDDAISAFNYNSSELIIDGVQPLSLAWNTSGYVRTSRDENTVEILFGNTATWSVTVTDANGCEAIVTSDLDPNANGNLGGPLTIVNDAMTSDSGDGTGSVEIFVEGGSGEYQYDWYGPDVNVIYPNGDFIDGLVSGWYVVYVTDVQTGEVQVGWYWVEPATRGRGKTAEQVALNAYPNPFDNTTQISFTIPTDAQTNIAVYSVDGQKIANLFNDKVVANTPTTVVFQAANLPAGMYVVRLQTETGLMQHHKLILNR